MSHANEYDFKTPVVRYYVDTRAYFSTGEYLPLIDRLPDEIQHAIRQYRRRPDRLMSLASALLKYYFIHKSAKIPWSQVKVSRTPKPHSRPYWAPTSHAGSKNCVGLEFNVSHQAGLVVLVGCKTPHTPRDVRINDRSHLGIHSEAVINPDPMAVAVFESEIDEDEPEDVRIGVDIACTWEPPRTPDLSTRQKFAEWVEVFAEMFSPTEQMHMKDYQIDIPDGVSEHDEKARRFYTYWALKEAYIKMVGEGLLASWLRDLEFRDVPVPARAESELDQWTILPNNTLSKMTVLFKNRDISNSMKTELEGFETHFVVATMTRGVTEMVDDEQRWKSVDLEGAIRACAEEACSCLR